MLGLSSKDFDVEVYGIQPDDLEQLVQSFGKVDSVGKAFGILKMTDGKMDIDVSIPRRDSKVHEGHRGFQVDTDPNMTIREKQDNEEILHLTPYQRSAHGGNF